MAAIGSPPRVERGRSAPPTPLQRDMGTAREITKALETTVSAHDECMQNRTVRRSELDEGVRKKNYCDPQLCAIKHGRALSRARAAAHTTTSTSPSAGTGHHMAGDSWQRHACGLRCLANLFLTSYLAEFQKRETTCIQPHSSSCNSPQTPYFHPRTLAIVVSEPHTSLKCRHASD